MVVVKMGILTQAIVALAGAASALWGAVTGDLEAAFEPAPAPETTIVRTISALEPRPEQRTVIFVLVEEPIMLHPGWM